MPTMRTLYAFIASAGVARADQRNFWADSATCEGSAMYAGPVVQHIAIENHQLNEVTFCERSVETAAADVQPTRFALGDLFSSPNNPGPQPRGYQLAGDGKTFHTSNGPGTAWVPGVAWGNEGRGEPTDSAHIVAPDEHGNVWNNIFVRARLSRTRATRTRGVTPSNQQHLNGLHDDVDVQGGHRQDEARELALDWAQRHVRPVLRVGRARRQPDPYRPYARSRRVVGLGTLDSLLMHRCRATSPLIIVRTLT